ncbi:MAG: hydroxyisourate hydrolase [Kangiella sp.]|nr:MAG: hydroxyisourate hydrolase [Kangiella sp.]
MSQITTHILDTSEGKPAVGVSVELFEQKDNQWSQLAKGVTNTDGRVAGLLSEDKVLDAGVYKMNFNTGEYFSANKKKGFYPYVDIVFELEGDGSHYHIPLLLSAFGYSTYRGS